MAYVLGDLNYFYRSGTSNNIVFKSKNGLTNTESFSDFRQLMYNYLSTLDTEYFWKFATFNDDNTTTVYLNNVNGYLRVNNSLIINFKDGSSTNLTFYSNGYCQNNLEYLNDMKHNYNTIVNDCNNYESIIYADNYTLNTFTDFSNMLNSVHAFSVSSGKYPIIKFSPNTTYTLSGSGTINLKTNVDMFFGENTTINFSNTVVRPTFSMTSFGKTRILGLGNFTSSNISGITGNTATGAILFVSCPTLSAKSEALFCANDVKIKDCHFMFYAGASSRRGAYRLKVRSITDYNRNTGVLNDSDGDVDYQDVDVRYFNAGSCWYPSIWNTTILTPLYHTQRMCYGKIYLASEDSGLSEYSAYVISGLYESSHNLWINSTMGRQDYRKYVNCIIKLNSNATDWIDCFDSEVYEIKGDVHLSSLSGPDAYISASGSGRFVVTSSLSSISYSALQNSNNLINNVENRYVAYVGGIKG